MTRTSSIASLAIFAFLLAACSDGTASNGIESGPLAGLVASQTNDTSAATPPQASTDPGYFRGTVMAPGSPGGGGDTLATKPRIAGVKVTIYPRIGTDVPPEAGDEAGSVVTGVDGLFQLPTLPAGEYIVTFVPPANSQYAGVYAFGPLNSNSKDYPWWVTLPLK
jgi:hypothetical protein